MNVFELVVDGLKAVARIVTGVADARKASVKDALNGYAAGRSAHDAASRAGRCPGITCLGLEGCELCGGTGRVRK